VSTQDEKGEVRFQGAPVSDGIAIGTPYFLSPLPPEMVPEFPITTAEVEDEIERYRRALFSSREDLERLQSDLANEGSVDAVSIIDTHIQMLEDPLMTSHMEERIRDTHQNTESVFRTVIGEFEKRLTETKDTFFQQRLVDVTDLSKRILGHLGAQEKLAMDQIPPNSVVFAKELVPSETAAVQATRISAFVTQIGGGHSHAALIARAKGIPFVASIDVQKLQNTPGACVIVDGVTGEIIVNPTSTTLRKYKALKKRLSAEYHQLQEEVHLPAKTLDGRLIAVYANAGEIGDVDQVHRYYAQGVGLFRSENLFLQNPEFVYSEEMQVDAYSQLLQRAKGLPVVIRVFDLGGDKTPPLGLEQEQELNPLMGCRGVRFLLRYKEVFRAQLRAIFKASQEGPVKLLLPLISDVEELRQAKQVIEEVLRDFPGLSKIPLGCMMEVPSAILMTDAIVQEVDFLSIGTNDLVQFTLGVDRSNASMTAAHFPAHPSVIRLIRMALLEAKRAKKPIAVCGEIASNPLFIPLLLGLGLEEFSCSPRFIPMLKRIIRRNSFQDAAALAECVLQKQTSQEVSKILIDHYRALLPEHQGAL